MLVHQLLENAAATVISSSLASNTVTGWQINKGLGTNVNTFPSVKVICRSYTPMYKEVNAGIGKAELEIITCAVKAVGDDNQGTTATEFETVSDYIFNPFLANNIAATLSTASLKVHLVTDEGLEVLTQSDGWLANQKLEVVLSRLS